MAKVKIKEKVEEVVGNIPEGMKIIDLTVEKRMELYQQVVQKFDEEMSKTYGLSLGVELSFSPQGIKPKMILVDLLAKKNESKIQEAPTETTKA